MIQLETSISRVAELTSGKIFGNDQLIFNSIVTDSRTISLGEGYLFVAICGEHHDGNKYISEMYEKGVRCFLTDKNPDVSRFLDAGFCFVPDALKALQDLAGARRKRFDGTIIGVTGSNGKTIVKEWLYQLMKNFYDVVRSPRSYNSQLGVPLSLWQLRDNFEFAVIEAGISQRGEMQRLADIVSPEIGILTNIGSAHAENFESDFEKLREKLKLFSNSSIVVFRETAKLSSELISEYINSDKIKVVSWSTETDAIYKITLSRKVEQTRITVEHPENSCELWVPFSDEASVENIIHVIVCMLELDVNPGMFEQHLKHLESVEMRLETLSGIYGTTLVNDVYNSDLAGLEVALDVLKQQHKHDRFTLILSDVFQSGMSDDELYAEVSELLLAKNIDRLIAVGEAISKQKDKFKIEAEFYQDIQSFLMLFNPSVLSGEAVLIKGARRFSFERITELLQSKYHKTVLEIDVNNLIDNLNFYRSLIKPATKVMVMVKALSYGSGSHEIAHLLQHEQVDYLSVAFADEGVALREAGVSLPIMVMNSDRSDFKKMIEFKLEPEIYCKEVLEDFLKACRYTGVQDSLVHIKLDTGMHRLGFEEKDMPKLLDLIKQPEIRIQSVFTHLAGAYDEHFDTFSKEQIELYQKLADWIEAKLDYKFMRHVLNTAGIERFEQYHMDMVRVGIGLYGHGGSESLKPVSTFKTAVSQIREVKAGETVGYDRAGKVEKDSLIATIPVGYADGIDRRLGNGNYSFILNGKEVPTIGNICMDMSMLDVSGFEVKLGDEIELIGKDNSVERMARCLGTISYEVLTGIPDRVRRVYVRTS